MLVIENNKALNDIKLTKLEYQGNVVAKDRMTFKQKECCREGKYASEKTRTKMQMAHHQYSPLLESLLS